jgi:hypothetical protein
MPEFKKLREVVEKEPMSNEDIMTHIPPIRRLAPGRGFRAHNDDRHKVRRTLYTTDNLMLAFEAICLSKKIGRTDYIERLIYNEVKRVAKLLPPGELQILIQQALAFERISESKEDRGKKGSDDVDSE